MKRSRMAMDRLENTVVGQEEKDIQREGEASMTKQVQGCTREIRGPEVEQHAQICRNFRS